MNYYDGRKIELGDHVDLGGGIYGVVVCDIDSGLFSADFTEVEWGGLQTGILIKTNQVGLMHFPVPSSSLSLIWRSE